jgi:MFS superfamily sulfate permease-like transporter
MQTGPRIDYNRELAAQGLGNALCGLLGALPMTGVIVRSSANLQAGARTRLSAILHGIWMLALVALLPDVLRLVPISGLAAILVYTGFKLVDVAQVRQLARYGRSEVFIYGITVVGIVAVDLLTGVLVGLACATAKLLYRLARLEIRIEDQPPRGTTVLHLKGSATFLRLPDVAEALERIPPERELHLRFDELDHVDHAALELINICVQRHRDRGGSVVLDWRRLNQCSDAQKPLEWPAA